MNKLPFYSVIIPIYNVEKYLNRCVDSILSQDFRAFEIILVNDGSPDRSGTICDEYALNFPLVKVVHKINGGAADARNIGVAIATGHYIVFLDGDDFWEGNDVLTAMYSLLSDRRLDVLIFGSTDIYEGLTERINSRGQFNLDEINKGKLMAIKTLISNNQFPGAAWQFCVNKKLLIENNIEFIKGIKAEDIDWVIHVFYKAENISALNINFHRYLKNRNSSVTNTADKKSLEDVLVSVNKWYLILKKDGSEVSEYLLSYLAFQYLTTYIIYARLNYNEQQHLLPKLQKYRSILKYSIDKRSRVFNILIMILGISASSKIMLMTYSVLQKIPTLRNFR